MPELVVHNIEGKEVDKVKLPEAFDKEINQDVLHQVVVMYQANKRQGTASTKVRKDVNGGGRKPFRQKGSGRARAGSTRSPLWKGGGVVFGPHPRDYSYSVPKKIRQQALRESLNAKYKDESLVCLDKMDIDSGKTKDFAKVLSTLNIRGKVLALLDGSDEKTFLSSRNIPNVSTQRSVDVNALDLMNNRKVLLTKASLEVLLKRLS